MPFQGSRQVRLLPTNGQGKKKPTQHSNSSVRVCRTTTNAMQILGVIGSFDVFLQRNSKSSPFAFEITKIAPPAPSLCSPCVRDLLLRSSCAAVACSAPHHMTRYPRQACSRHRRRARQKTHVISIVGKLDLLSRFEATPIVPTKKKNSYVLVPSLDLARSHGIRESPHPLTQPGFINERIPSHTAALHSTAQHRLHMDMVLTRATGNASPHLQC